MQVNKCHALRPFGAAPTSGLSVRPVLRDCFDVGRQMVSAVEARGRAGRVGSPWGATAYLGPLPKARWPEG
eukprot:5546402-Lingulodinium_polyedra.AAC.1